MVMAGVWLAAVGVILVHKTSAMTSRYAHLSQDHLRDAVNALSDFTGHKSVTSEGGAADE
jgi:hypothetical protein